MRGAGGRGHGHVAPDALGHDDRGLAGEQGDQIVRMVGEVMSGRLDVE